jgi:predicted DCC family thiol-disulfide oxidoreductase YuxK
MEAMPTSAGPVEAGAPAPETDLVFYDGDCGFCHETVRFLIGADVSGARFRFAPLGGETFRARIPAEARAELPDSLVVLGADGRLRLRGDAALHLLRRLGGGYRVVARLLALLPRPLRDAAYDAFARIRHRLFGRPERACPVLAPALRARFDP